MTYPFFAYIARMRYIGRWGLMRNTEPENIQEHSHMVAVLAHAIDASQADRPDAILIARHAIVAKTALIWPIDLSEEQRTACEAQLAARGIVVRESA